MPMLIFFFQLIGQTKHLCSISLGFVNGA